ncbi:MAG: hypothetical protein R3F56_01775 [Planctomycetota bacterium]
MKPRLFPLSPGSHPSPDAGMCAMEMVAWLAGEPHSDEPLCACPVAGAVVRCFNDSIASTSERERLLRPLVPALVNSRATAAVERARAFLVADCAARRIAPRILCRGYREADARTLARMPKVTDRRSAFATLAHLHGAELKATRWVVQRAADGELAPRLWVAGLVWSAKELGGKTGWELVAETVRAMLALGRSERLAGEVAPPAGRTADQK